jgi:hypothetical protein
MIGSNAATGELLTCGHPLCRCPVDTATLFCSDSCEKNGDAATPCSCGHKECMTTGASPDPAMVGIA